MQEYSQGVPAFFYLTRIYSFAGRQHKTYSFPCVLCNPWIFLVAYGKMFWSSEDRVKVPFHGTFSRHGRIKASFILLIWLNENVRFHYAESRQNKTIGKSLEEIFNKNMAYGQKYIIGI